MASFEHTHRLCIYCRKIEVTSEPCPFVSRPPQTSTNDAHVAPPPPGQGSGLSLEDDALIRSLQNEYSTLCSRCTEYDIIKMFTESQPLDTIQRRYGGLISTQFADESQQYIERMAPYRKFLGRPSSIYLTPSCPFCRLLYCILPRSLDMGDRDVHIEPYRSHIRQEGWEIFPDELKERSAVFLGLADMWSPFTPTSAPFKASDDIIQFPMMTGPAICMDTSFLLSDRSINNARLLDRTLDTSILLKALEYCEQHHGDECRAEKPFELLTTRMIDVVERNVVPCPENCDYIALSYVWGGVQPAEGALQNRCLPRTIEDAITVTKALNRRFLWVDALCIDQSPNPSPHVLERKMQQLGMMATIYGCATVTIVALTGTNSNAGLAGVSIPRPGQISETIDEYKLHTVPQYISVDREISGWSTRAWTLQEELLSLRLLQFTESQVDFTCLLGSFWEGLDTSTSFRDLVPKHPTQSLARMMTRAPSSSYSSSEGGGEPESFEGRMKLFDGILQTYTSRRMTNAGDSLNAFLGMLTGLQRRLFPLGFMHGLPLRYFPVTLAWMHDRNVKPQRRLMFPSWSWAGWEGTALIPRDLLNVCEENEDYGVDLDLDLTIIAIYGNELVVEGWVADLDIRTEPFSEVFVPGQENSIASVMEGRFLHNNTILTNHHVCLVAQRQCDKDSTRVPPRQKTFLIVLDMLEVGLAQRRTMITVTSFAGCDFMQTKPTLRKIRLI